MADETAIWDVLRKHGALMPPATPERIEVANEDLEAGGFLSIPADYADSLLKANGLQCPAFMLLGTAFQPMAGGDHLEAIFEATERLMASGDKAGRLVLGYTGGNLVLVFDAKAQNYRLIDGSCEQVLYTFETIAAFMEDWLKRKKLL